MLPISLLLFQLQYDCILGYPIPTMNFAHQNIISLPVDGMGKHWKVTVLPHDRNRQIYWKFEVCNGGNFKHTSSVLQLIILVFNAIKLM